MKVQMRSVCLLAIDAPDHITASAYRVLSGIVNTIISVFKDTLEVLWAFLIARATQSTIVDVVVNACTSVNGLSCGGINLSFCFRMSRYSVYRT